MDLSRLLVLAPHADDLELGAGGLVSRLVASESKVLAVNLTDRGEPEWFTEEVAESLKCLCDNGNLEAECYDFSVFDMHSERGALLRTFERLRRDWKPTFVLCPADQDLHQDHTTCLQEARRAFKGISLAGYEICRSNVRFRPNLFIPVSEADIEKKCRAVQCYKSQCHKLYMQPDTIRGLARLRGAQAEVEFAEAFQVEWIVG